MRTGTVTITSLAFVGPLAASLAGRSTRNGSLGRRIRREDGVYQNAREPHSMSTGKVLLVRRFDCGADGTRVHLEDFAQLFGRYPSEKYPSGFDP
jgi:hypothetical protein